MIKKIIVLFFLLGILWGCSSQEDNQEENVITIGAVVPLTGPAANFGTILTEGYEWKIQELRDEGQKIEFFIEDSKSSPQGAATAFNNLVHVRKVDKIMTVLSGVSMALKPLAQENEILLLSINAHPDFTEDATYLLRHSNIADSDAKVIGEHIIANEHKSVGILYQQDDWGVSLKDELEAIFSNKRISVSHEAIDHTAADFRTQITKIKGKNPDVVIFIAVGPASGLLIKQTRELQYEGELYSSVGLVLTPDATEIAGEYLSGTYYHTYKANPQFASDYKQRYDKEPAVFGFMGYTDVELLFYAMEQTNSQDPKIIIDYIKNLGNFQGKYEEVSITRKGDIIIPTTIQLWE